MRRGPPLSVDATGNPGICDWLASQGIKGLDRVNYAHSPGISGRVSWAGARLFRNVRAEMHWIARRGLQEGVFVINPAQFPKSAQEATWAKYEREAVVGGTQVTIEKKVEIIRREGHSPDHWDAIIMAMRQTQPGIFARTAGTSFLGKKAGRPRPGNPLQPGSRHGNGRTRMPGSTAAREDGGKPWKPGAVDAARDGWRGR